MENCIFCKIVKGEIPCYKVYEDEHTLAFLDINPMTEYHTLVIPKAHYTNVLDIPAGAFSHVMHAAKAVVDLYRIKLGVENLQLVHNAGEHAQQDVFHLHVHIVPRKAGDGANTIWPKAKHELRDKFTEMLVPFAKMEEGVAEEIDHYNSLPCEFAGFIDVPHLTNGDIHLVCVQKRPANPEKKHVPSYDFAICKGSEKVGEINLRIGYGGGEKGDNLYYGGQIGYGIDEAHRGNGYAAEACKLLRPIAKAHKMSVLLITNNVTNHASRRVCEKIGARHIRTVRLPQHSDLYKEGQRFSNIFEMEV